MKRLTIRNLKHELRDKHLKILKPGERHKDFTYPVFVELPKTWTVTPTTPLELSGSRTCVCFAGDISNNEIRPYCVTKFDWEQDHVVVFDVDSKMKMTFYADSVAVIPSEILPPSWRLKMLGEDELIDNDNEKRRERRERRSFGHKKELKDISSKEASHEEKSSSSDSSHSSTVATE